MSILALPSTTDDAILDRLSAAELFKYGRTCKPIHSVIESYIARAFQLHKLLAPYFTPTQISHFRKLQASTGMLISGSTALQFFDRIVYPDSDLDLYVQHTYREEIGRWLLDIGYIYVPQQENVGIETFEEALGLQPEPRMYDPLLGHSFLQQGGNGYIGASCIFTFIKKKPYQKIELISSLNSPLERILNFHSTCVMNIIAHDKAYSFFPRGTFTERRSLVCARPTLDDLALKKYASRGWTVSYGISSEELANTESLSCTSAFAQGPRYVGDSECWTLPVYPALDEASLQECVGGIEANSWDMKYNKAHRPKMSYCFVHSRELLFTYLVADDDTHLHRHIAEIFMRARSASAMEGDSQRGSPLDRQLMDLINWYRGEDHTSNTCPLSSTMTLVDNPTLSITPSSLAMLLRLLLQL